jgi:hypothetical protein
MSSSTIISARWLHIRSISTWSDPPSGIASTSTRSVVAIFASISNVGLALRASIRLTVRCVGRVGEPALRPLLDRAMHADIPRQHVLRPLKIAQCHARD